MREVGLRWKVGRWKVREEGEKGGGGAGKINF